MPEQLRVETPRRFLVGLREDDSSDGAAHAAGYLASRLGSEIQLLHVFPLPTPGWIGESVPEYVQKCAGAAAPVQESIRERLRAIEENNALEPGSLAEGLNVECGYPARTIVERAQRDAVDWIFLGPHKRHRFGIGNTSRGVFHRTECELWMQPCEVRPLHRVLVPVDGSAAGTRALGHACMLAKVLDLELTVLHVFNPLQFHKSLRKTESDLALRGHAQQGFQSYLEAFEWPVSYQADLASGDPGETILERQAADQVIVMGTSGHTALADTFLGRVVASVIRSAETPVLAVHKSRR